MEEETKKQEKERKKKERKALLERQWDDKSKAGWRRSLACLLGDKWTRTDWRLLTLMR